MAYPIDFFLTIDGRGRVALFNGSRSTSFPSFCPDSVDHRAYIKHSEWYPLLKRLVDENGIAAPYLDDILERPSLTLEDLRHTTPLVPGWYKRLDLQGKRLLVRYAQGSDVPASAQFRLATSNGVLAVFTVEDLLRSSVEEEDVPRCIAVWHGGSARHWYEFAFAPIKPSRCGIYLYQHSFMDPSPHLRCGHPLHPITRDSLPVGIRELPMLELSEADFGKQECVQLAEYVPCKVDLPDRVTSWTSSFWIPSNFSQLVPIDPEALPLPDHVAKGIITRAKENLEFHRKLGIS